MIIIHCLQALGRVLPENLSEGVRPVFQNPYPINLGPKSSIFLTRKSLYLVSGLTYKVVQSGIEAFVRAFVLGLSIGLVKK